MSGLLDKWGHHDAMPQFTIPSAEPRGRPQRTATDGLGHPYRVERDFPTSNGELPSGMLTTSASSPSFSFSGEDRTDGRGKLKGMNFPLGRWHNDAGPGQYDLEAAWPVRQRAKQPHYSVPKAARVTQTLRRGPGPGEYNLPSQFGSAGARRLEPLEPTVRRGAKKCFREAEFNTIFRSIHASARRGPRVDRQGSGSVEA